jgi:hypothetical protein
MKNFLDLLLLVGDILVRSVVTNVAHIMKIIHSLAQTVTNQAKLVI